MCDEDDIVFTEIFIDFCDPPLEEEKRSDF